MERIKVFVYGTLKRGGEQHGVLQQNELVRKVRLDSVSDYRLYRMDVRFPAAVLWNGGEIEGEVYEVPMSLVPYLDAIEAVPFLFRQQLVQLKQSGDWALMYAWNSSLHYLEPMAENRWEVPRQYEIDEIPFGDDPWAEVDEEGEDGVD